MEKTKGGEGMSVMNVDEQMERITDALSILTTNVKLHNSRGRTDINKEAEDFYCGLLNIVLGKNLENLNLLEMDFPAIDLADKEGRLCVQVSSTEERNKVDRTLEKFFAKELDKQFDRLIVLVIGKKPRYQSGFTTQRGFDFDHERDVWDLPKLLLEIEKLDEEKRSDVDQYLSARVNTGAGKKQYPDLPLRTALEGDAFVGRGAELAEIDRRFRTEQVLFLTGLGGMGKTELAVRYARDYVQAKGYQVYQVLFSDTLTQTLLNNVAPNVPDLDTRNMPEKEILRRTVDALNRSGPKALLILDNADQANLTALRRDLSVLNLKVLVTTRISGDKNGIRTTRLTREELYKIFDRHGADVPRNERDALIDAVAGHTMTVDMIARTLADEWCDASPEKICAAMKGSEMDEEAYPEIETDHDGDPEQRRIYGHLCALFRLQGLKEEEKHALRCAALLPPDGMYNQLFRKALPEECRKSIQELEKRGWVQSENKLLTIHPVVRLVCRRELSPTVENCDDFLEWFRGQYDRTTYEREKFSQIAALYETASEVLRETDGFWANEAGYLWLVLRESRRALTCNQRAVALREQNTPNSQSLATAYGNLGSTYGHLGDHEKELEYQLKALAIKEQVLPPTHPSLATSYNNVGMTYGDLGDHEKELEYQLKALSIREQVLPPTHPDLATSYNNVGSTYGDLGDQVKALEYKLKALAIREQVLPPTHPSLATSYNNVGSTYGHLGDREKELEYQLKALGILEQSLPPDHPNIVIFRSNIAVTYAQMDDFIRANEYMRRALDSAERSMRGHPDLEQYRQAAQILELCAKFQEAGMPLPFDNPFKRK